MDSPKRLQPAGTPKPAKKLYWPKFTEEGSPKMCGFYEKQEEFGWDDSPEPLKFDPKLITGHSKKKIDCLESPVSSHPKKRIQRRSSPKIYSQSADKDLAYMQELSRRILSTCSNSEPSQISNVKAKLDSATSEKETVHSNDSTIATDSRTRNNVFLNASSSSRHSAELHKKCPPSQLPETTFDSVLQSFFEGEEEDEWLSQVDVAQDIKETPNKSKFSKSLSDNNLESPTRSSFRRSASFQCHRETARSKQEKNSSLSSNVVKKPHIISSVSQCENLPPEGQPQPLKKQKSFQVESSSSQTVCSWEEIERKRLEAKFRREFKEIERKKLEAQKRLNERKNRELIKR